jgi:hypothetical protein
MPDSEMQRLDCGSAEVVTTINDRLVSKKRRLESELADVNAALDALQEHPEVAKVLSLVSKAAGRL